MKKILLALSLTTVIIAAQPHDKEDRLTPSASSAFRPIAKFVDPGTSTETAFDKTIKNMSIPVVKSEEDVAAAPDVPQHKDVKGSNAP